MELWQSIVLGIVQGITEFLPVSGSGHLALIDTLLVIDGNNTLAFSGAVYCAITGALILYLWRDILNLFQTLFRKLGRLPVNEKDFILLKAVSAATVPMIIGTILLENYIDETLWTRLIVAGGMFLGAVFLMYTEWKYFSQPKNIALSTHKGVVIGLIQALALLPGFSRVGMAVAGGMTLGLTRAEAARFAFLIAVPITLVKGIHKSLELVSSTTSLADTGISWPEVAVGGGVAFCLALITMHFFLRFVERNTLWPFIWYNLVLSALIVYGEFFAF